MNLIKFTRIIIILEFMKKDHNYFINFIVRYWILLIIVVVGQLAYIIFSKLYFGIGFPLDDSWIHQTYARNLLQFNEWYFIPGIKSAGSTAPLWTIFLIPGHMFGNNFYFLWTFVISGFLLFAICVVSQEIFNHLSSEIQPIPWIGILISLEWHIVWSANSGMETILFILLILLFTFFFIRKQDNFWLLGLLIGLIIFVRPDGLTLIGPFLLVMIYSILFNKESGKKFFLSLIIIIIFAVLFAFFNYRLSGEPLPNTFFAKQSEYEILFSQPLILRFINLFIIPITGVGVLLIPGFIYYFYEKLKTRDLKIISIYLWAIGYIAVYALRLPVTYQHGRYIIPIIPIFLILSMLGLKKIMQQKYISRKSLIFAYKLLTISILLIFFYLGAKAYALDVAIVETEMVETAQWINNNLDEDSIIAAHDIGALGFFSTQKIIDLAGLISPEVIPFIRDEAEIEKYLNQNQADYLVVFPGWYEKLNWGKVSIYTSNGEFSPLAGGENMTIYIWSD